MRTIKFKGKKLHNGKWVCGYLTDVDNTPIGNVGIINSKPLSGCEESSMVIAETIGQFTGLHDKNGNEIYEGDIMLFHGREYFAVWDEEEARFVFTNKTNNRLNAYKSTSEECFEIIGNIHDTRNY